MADIQMPEIEHCGSFCDQVQRFAQQLIKSPPKEQIPYDQ